MKINSQKKLAPPLEADFYVLFFYDGVVLQ